MLSCTNCNLLQTHAWIEYKLLVLQPFSIQTWIEALRQIFQWPKYINTATFVISLISILLLIVVRIVNVKALSKIKCVCCRYSHSRRVCFISQRWKWPIPIPSPLLLVSD